MEILVGNKLSKSYILQTVLQEVSFSVEAGDKVGIMGVNGAGKSTLFGIIAGEVEQDSGTITKAREATIAYMPQQSDYYSERTGYEEALTVFSHLQEMEAELQALQLQMEAEPSDEIIARYSRLNETFMASDGLIYKNRTASMLLNLGLEEEEQNLKLSALSGGQRTRVLLAKLLLTEPDILLLDEPTNHLDLTAIEWLEEFLSSYKGTVLVISHDRYFLDAFINRVFEIEHHGLTPYRGNYSDFVRQKEEALLTAERDYEKKVKEVKRIESIVEEQKRWGTERAHITAAHKQKAADRIKQEIVEPRQALREIRFSFEESRRSGHDVLTVDGLSKSFDGQELFRGISLHIARQDRMFLLGDNGVGKTTLFRILTGELMPDHGEVDFGTKVDVGYYTQAQENLPQDKTILEAVYEQVEETQIGRIRNILALFLFTGDDIDKKISVLSGGEKARVSLAILMLSKCNLLLLDEPTNHLDVQSREVLEQALSQYNGTLFVISHDRYFVRKLATKICVMERAGMRHYNGDYDYYLHESKKHAHAFDIIEEKTITDSARYYEEQKRVQSERRRLGRQVERLEREIAALESEIESLENELNLPQHAHDYEKIVHITEEIHSKQEALHICYLDWEHATEEHERYLNID